MAAGVSNSRPQPDKLLVDIAEYVDSYEIASSPAYDLAYYCLIDSLACAFEALQHSSCRMLLGPTVPGMEARHGAKVPGTSYYLDPVTAAFNIGSMIRWLDLNDTFLAAERGHPSDNLGGILAVADYVNRQRLLAGETPLRVKDVLEALIKAYEIHGVLAIENSFTKLGFDHVILVRVASTAVVTKLLGGTKQQIVNALSNAWADGFATKVYRQAPNVGTRKNWAAGDATARAVYHALMALRGEDGYPTVLTAEIYGIYDALRRGKPFGVSQPYGTYIVENILFKSVPAEMMTQTGFECALQLHPLVKDRLDEIADVEIFTTEPAMGIVVKDGPLHNVADRDHCLQYVVAVGLIFGQLTADHFEDHVAADARIDALRAKMRVAASPRYSEDFYLPEKRSSANSVQVSFKDGTKTPLIEVEYPVGHPRRRTEGLAMVQEKLERNVRAHYPQKQAEDILAMFGSRPSLDDLDVSAVMDRLAM